jgi:hypothetical protein
MRPMRAAPKIPSRRGRSRFFSVPSVFYALKDFTVCESRKNPKAFNTENTEGTEKTETRPVACANHRSRASGSYLVN